MRLKLLILSFTILSISLQAQFRKIVPSKEISTKVYSDLKGFTSLDLANDFKAYVTYTDGPEMVKIEANENLQQYIKVDMDGNTLIIKFNGDMNIRGKETLHAYISTKSLKNFRASSDSYIYLENTMKTENARITLRGDSQLEGDVSVKNLYLNLRGDSILKIEGEADEVEAELRGDSVMRNKNLDIKEGKFTLRGDSVVKVSVSDKLWADLDGDSVLHYSGSPNIMKSRVTGDSEMEQINR